MGSVVFTARRSAMHADGVSVALDVDLQSATRSRDVRKFPVQASDGTPESLYEGADTRWDLEFEPVAGAAYTYLQEFLDSTASGDSFQVWAYGSEAAPVVVKRIDDGYTPQPFIATGSKQADPWVVRITVIEVS